MQGACSTRVCLISEEVGDSSATGKGQRRKDRLWSWELLLVQSQRGPAITEHGQGHALGSARGGNSRSVHSHTEWPRALPCRVPWGSGPHGSPGQLPKTHIPGPAPGAASVACAGGGRALLCLAAVPKHKCLHSRDKRKINCSSEAGDSVWTWPGFCYKSRINDPEHCPITKSCPAPRGHSLGSWWSPQALKDEPRVGGECVWGREQGVIRRVRGAHLLGTEGGLVQSCPRCAISRPQGRSWF